MGSVSGPTFKGRGARRCQWMADASATKFDVATRWTRSWPCQCCQRGDERPGNRLDWDLEMREILGLTGWKCKHLGRSA